MRRSNNHLHLERRASSFYWRRRLPKLFSKNHPNPFLVFSLRTQVVREAEVLARRLTWLSFFPIGRHVLSVQPGKVLASSPRISGFSKAKKRLDGLTGVSGWLNHDLRRSFATYATQNLGALPLVVGRILNHQSGSVTGIDAVYQRGEYLDERRAILNEWGNFVVDL